MIPLQKLKRHLLHHKWSGLMKQALKFLLPKNFKVCSPTPALRGGLRRREYLQKCLPLYIKNNDV
jgi:hypothetical protein